MKRKYPFLGRGWFYQLTVISAMTVLCSTAKADISSAQAQAIAENGAGQTAKFLLGVLGACANTYPDTRNDVVNAIRSMAPTKLEDEEVTRIINAVGQCMSNEGAPTKSQCSDLATQLPNTSFDPNDKQYSPTLMAGLKMLEPCRRGN